MIGKKVMEFGDEIEALRMKIRQDSDFQEFVDHAVADSDGRRASLTAFEEFTAIANQVLEVDDTGVGKGTVNWMITRQLYTFCSLCNIMLDTVHRLYSI